MIKPTKHPACSPARSETFHRFLEHGVINRGCAMEDYLDL